MEEVIRLCRRVEPGTDDGESTVGPHLICQGPHLGPEGKEDYPGHDPVEGVEVVVVDNLYRRF